MNICILSNRKEVANLREVLKEPLYKIVSSIDEADTVIVEPGMCISDNH